MRIDPLANRSLPAPRNFSLSGQPAPTPLPYAAFYTVQFYCDACARKSLLTQTYSHMRPSHRTLRPPTPSMPSIPTCCAASKTPDKQLSRALQRERHTLRISLHFPPTESFNTSPWPPYTQTDTNTSKRTLRTAALFFSAHTSPPIPHAHTLSHTCPSSQAHCLLKAPLPPQHPCNAPCSAPVQPTHI